MKLVVEFFKPYLLTINLKRFMNKRFYTLMAGIMLAGSAFSTASATEVTAEQFKGAIVENVLSIEKLKETLKKENLTFDGNIELKDNVTLEDGSNAFTPASYVVIKEAVKLTSLNAESPVTFTGRIVVEEDGVEISNLKLYNKIGNGVKGGNEYNTSISGKVDKLTVKGVEFTAEVAEGNTTNVVNGLTLTPKTNNAAYTIEGNTFKDFAKVVTDTYGTWYSCAFQIYQNGDVKITFDDAALIAKNTFEGNDCDAFIRHELELNEDYAPVVAHISPKSVSAAADAVLKDAGAKGGKIVFNGTEKEFAKYAGNATENYPVNTKDGVVVAGVTRLPAELFGFKLEETETSAASMLVLAGSDGNCYVVKADENGTCTAVGNGGATEDQVKALSTDENALWVMSTKVDHDGSI